MANGKFAQPVTDTILDNTQALLVPGLVALQKSGGCPIEDRRLHRVERGKHPCDRTRPGIRIVWQQAHMALRDVQHDRARLEQDKIAFFIGRNLPKRMKRSRRGFLQRSKRNQTNIIRLANFLERPANAHVTRKSLAPSGDRSKAVMVGVMGKSYHACGAALKTTRFSRQNRCREYLAFCTLSQTPFESQPFLFE
jgi:hypothetical protein